MSLNIVSDNNNELKILCGTIRTLLKHNEFEECETLICDAMGKNPNAPEPHNLLGVLLERKGNHECAMRHFRAAWDLEPTYLPARRNLENYSSFFIKRKYAIDESDCKEEETQESELQFDENGIGHIRRRKNNGNTKKIFTSR